MKGVPKLMNFVLNMLDFTLKMMNFVFIMMKGWIRGRVTFLKDEIRTACAQNLECAGLVDPSSWVVNGQTVNVKRPHNCKFATDVQLAGLCAEAGILTGTASKCVQASMGPVCVIDTDPCASSPCQNGGRCRTVTQDAVPDACGCITGKGWSGSNAGCTDGKSTSLSEARSVFNGRILVSYHQNPDFLFRNPGFRLKNINCIMKQSVHGATGDREGP